MGTATGVGSMTDIKPTAARLRAMRLALRGEWHPSGTGEWQLTQRLLDAGLLCWLARMSIRITDEGKEWLKRHD